MLSHTQTKKGLRKALDNFKKIGRDIQYPMVKFRHAIYQVTDKCPAIKDNIWTFDIKNELTICNLFYKTTRFQCSYDYKTNNVKVIEYKGDVKSREFNCVPEDLADKIHEYQPKIKMLRKK